MVVPSESFSAEEKKATLYNTEQKCVQLLKNL